ncbi:MAG: hypothetical protein H5T65_07155 [Chloroflexi bacterium]|nr:hypothetical protein [Chloroflexota bacterium]
MEELLVRLLKAPAVGYVQEDYRAGLAERLGLLVGGDVYAQAIAASPDGLFFLWRGGGGKRLAWLRTEPGREMAGDIHPIDWGGHVLYLTTAPLSHDNLKVLRRHLPFLSPRVAGLRGSFGFGDRIGVATPGHVRAARRSGLVPFFAQQSIREMARTERTPQGVMDDAIWGVFQAGWDRDFGADADHLKTPEDVAACAAAGYTMFTVDPGDHVDNQADVADVPALRERLERAPWGALRTSWRALEGRYSGKSWRIEAGVVVEFDDERLARAVVKYGRAIAHTASLYEHVRDCMSPRPFELEMSVDETEAPTTPEEHFFIAQELQRLGVEWVSLAPRFVGSFQKGIDYIGDLKEFERSFAAHAAIARRVGPYKISIHSGSDKFSIYGIAARHTEGLLHVKTAGTSYLEALRVAAHKAPDLFREILGFAKGRFEHDRATYAMSPALRNVPDPDALADGQLPGLLEQPDARQVLHVTFGSVMTHREGGEYRFRDRLVAMLLAHEETYYHALEQHFVRHFEAYG